MSLMPAGSTQQISPRPGGATWSDPVSKSQTLYCVTKVLVFFTYVEFGGIGIVTEKL